MLVKNNHGFYGDVCPHCGCPKVKQHIKEWISLHLKLLIQKKEKAEFKLRDLDGLDRMREIG